MPAEHAARFRRFLRGLWRSDHYLGELYRTLEETGLADSTMLVLTADHGCDPTTPSTDHSREYVPVLVFGHHAKPGVPLGLRATLSDLGQTVAENFGCHLEKGTSFLPAIV